MDGLATPLLQQGLLARQGGTNLFGIDGFGLRGPVALDLLFAGASDDALDQRRLARLDGQHGLHLGQGLVQGEVRRGDAQRGVVSPDFGLLVHQPAKGFHPGQVGVSVRLGLDAMLVVEEVGDRLVGSRQLRQYVRLAGA